MHIVYIIQSKKFPDRIYRGYTTNLKCRVGYHNQGLVPSTKGFKPWILVFYASFSNKIIAQKFERYLKTGSGTAFMRKRLM